MAEPNAEQTAKKVPWLNYRTIWRWHFYAGVFCIPFVLWLAATGSVYLFKPQVEAWMDRPYEQLEVSGQRTTPEEQVKAALAAVPGSNLRFYQLPRSEHGAAQIIVGRNADEFRVYVSPYSLAVLKVVNEDARLMTRVFHLHGELLMGDRGSWIVETAGSWAVIMLLTGLYLWWPRDAKSVAGVLYPRLHMGGRGFWRDVHAVTGMWVSVFALLFLLSGLPWAKSWGAYFKLARRLSGETQVRQDWTTGRASELAQRMARNGVDEHAGHRHGMAAASMSYAALNTVVPAVAPLGLAFPVLIAPPQVAGGAWQAKSDTPNRPLRVQLTVDGATGAILSRTNFSQRAWIDRVVGTGIAMHEGQLYGWLNQAVNLGTAMGLAMLCISAGMMWWKRRPVGALGAPVKQASVRWSAGFAIAVCALAVYLPLFGATLLLTVLAERLLLRRLPAASAWLGLTATAGSSGIR